MIEEMYGDARVLLSIIGVSLVSLSCSAQQPYHYGGSGIRGGWLVYLMAKMDVSAPKAVGSRFSYILSGSLLDLSEGYPAFMRKKRN